MHSFDNDFNIVRRIFCDVVPVRCEQRYDIDGFEYIGISGQFDIVNPGCLAPEYIIEITKNKSGSNFKFKKVED